jgi:hypothetical protein
MIQHRFPRILTLLSLSTLVLGAMGCSNSQSPTEPASFDTPVVSKSLAVSTDKRHGADDPAGDDRGGRRGRGTDDPANGGNGGVQQRPPRAGVEREGAVASIDTAAGALVLAGGQRVAVNGQTQWNKRGDLFSLQQVAAAVRAGKPTRAEGSGTLQADGSLLAKTLKAEVGR